MASFSIGEMKKMQIELQEKYKENWTPLCAENGQNQLLWMIGEVGEVIDIIKKNGAAKAMATPEMRSHLIEEMADVLMYYNDVLLCYDISEDELRQAYISKFDKNMKRW